MAAPETLAFGDSPQTAKLRFKLRTLYNFLWGLGIFIPLAFLASPFWFAGIFDLVAIAVLFYLFFWVWDKRVIKIRCPNSSCRKIVRTNTPWVCGFRQCKNLRADEFPFVYHCEHCGAEPKAYKCHHCGELIFLTDDRQEQNYAVCLNTQLQPPPADPPTARKEKQVQLQDDIVITKLEAELEANKQRLEFTTRKKKTPFEEIEEDFMRDHARIMGAQEYADLRQAMNEEKYKNNKEMLERENAFIRAWLRKHTP